VIAYDGSVRLMKESKTKEEDKKLVTLTDAENDLFNEVEADDILDQIIEHVKGRTGEKKESKM